MEAIKRWLDPKKKKASDRPGVSWSASGSFDRLQDQRTFDVAQREISVVTPAFIPRDRGRQETLAWMNSGTFDNLNPILKVRDRAARQVRRGPKTKGTSQVQRILRRPTRETVEQLHRVCRQAEMTVRYGRPAAAAYNFSFPLSWNQATGPRLPPLRLRNFGDSMGRGNQRASQTPAVPFKPIDWLILPGSKEAEEQDSSSSVNEEGGSNIDPGGIMPRPASRMSPSREQDVDDNEMHPGLPSIPPNFEVECDPYMEEEDDDPYDDDLDDSYGQAAEAAWVASEARALTVIQVPVQKVRKVRIKRKARPMDVMPQIDEVSSGEECDIADEGKL
ncbi:hypothetical protein F4780DRAFT_614157 [Xylariomycetidae sp. FL0641]|nr:hypothetical protein F4780DRAFT_614157 [Xylariomycetidae sp. FL0641]